MFIDCNVWNVKAMMHYQYTWNHIVLLAHICGCKDTKETVTDNWVRILENQQQKMFPFTLWPLTYRTSTMIASPAMSSPSMANISSKNVCEVTTKFYKSNDVLIICFQCSEHWKKNLLSDQGNIVAMYDKVNTKTMKMLSKCQDENPEQEIKCIICTGYGMGATIATLLAHDLAREFDEEAKFLGLENPKTTVDCVCFSMPEMGNDEYWNDFKSVVDEHITIRHTEETAIKFPTPSAFIGNANHDNLSNNHNTNNDKCNNHNTKTKTIQVSCRRYMEDIEKMLTFSFS